MGTKSCTKILNFSTRFSCENLAVEDFLTLFMGKKILMGIYIYIPGIYINVPHIARVRINRVRLSILHVVS